jgi:hypothetical protein
VSEALAVPKGQRMIKALVSNASLSAQGRCVILDPEMPVST